MVLENKVYVPTLAVRPSEMTGLEYLWAATKDRITPCFLLAPWANSNSIERTITRIERAFPNRPYFLDIDPDYQITNHENSAQFELLQLKDATNCFENWVSFNKGHEWAWPCIQTRDQSKIQIENQIRAIQTLGRPYCMRVVKDQNTDNIEEVVDAFAAGGTADYAIILEGGWTNDPLSLSLWFSGFINQSLQAIDAAVPIVVSFTSMPKMFDKFNQDQPASIPFGNRLIVEQVARSTNRARVMYGDWGSTRPRDIRSMARRPLDRVDYPTERAWLIARNRDSNWDFRNAAQAIVRSPAWDGKLGIWGEELISNTTINKELGIDTPQKNVAARVNIHLHRQAFYGQMPVDPIAFDEEWQD